MLIHHLHFIKLSQENFAKLKSHLVHVMKNIPCEVIPHLPNLSFASLMLFIKNHILELLQRNHFEILEELMH